MRSEFEVYDAGDVPNPQELEITKRAGEYLSSTWPQVIWQVQVQGGLLVMRVGPWNHDEDDFTVKEDRLAGNHGFVIPLSALNTTDGSYKRKLRHAGGTLMDAWGFSTETGLRIHNVIELPG